MTLQQIETRCREKSDELIDKHFGNVVEKVAIEHPETISDYSLDLPKQIKAEFYAYLKDLWEEIVQQGSPSFEKIIDKKHLSDSMTEDNRALAAAERGMQSSDSSLNVSGS